MRENRLRRVAARRGYRLMKCRRRDEKALGFGGYKLVDARTNSAIAGAHPYEFSATLDDVEESLAR